MSDLLNIIDLEATCWEGEAPPGQRSEIIEVGVCVLNVRTLERVEKRSLRVRPQHSEVSAFCTELTGWTALALADGLSFREACEVLRRDFHADSRPWASWGDYDRKQFEQQCAASGVPYPLSSAHTNAKKVFTQAHGLKKRPGMAQALELLGLPLEGRHHNGADDAWNIAAIVASLLREGLWTA